MVCANYKIAGQMTRARQLLGYWLPPLLWAAVVLGMGGSGSSGGRTELLIQRLLTPLLGDLSQDTIFLINYAVRKSAHIAAYALLAVLNFRALRGAREGWAFRWSCLAVLLAGVVAVTDEYRQSLEPTRTGSARDVAFDVWGAAVSQFFVRGRGA